MIFRASSHRRRPGPGRCGLAALAVLVAGQARAEQAAGPRGIPDPARRSAQRPAPLPTVADASDAEIDALIEKIVPARSDTPADWMAGPVLMYRHGEPRMLPPCIPPAPCHPAYPPHPADLVGARGLPTCGPRYRGPCQPRLGTHDDSPLPRLHALCDAAFDAFYRSSR